MARGLSLVLPPQVRAGAAALEAARAGEGGKGCAASGRRWVRRSPWGDTEPQPHRPAPPPPPAQLAAGRLPLFAAHAAWRGGHGSAHVCSAAAGARLPAGERVGRGRRRRQRRRQGEAPGSGWPLPCCPLLALLGVPSRAMPHAPPPRPTTAQQEQQQQQQAASGDDAAAGEQYARVAGLYRQAAGVYAHIDEELYPSAAEGLPADRPGGWVGGCQSGGVVVVGWGRGAAQRPCRAPLPPIRLPLPPPPP